MTAALEPAIALGFDFDHTLGLDNGLERRALHAYAAELGHPPSPSDAERIDALLARFRSGALAMDALMQRFAAPLPGVEARAERWQAICYGLVDELVQPLDGARDLLARARERGIPVAILTNGWTPLQQKKIARALGDAALALTILVSDALYAAKPDVAAFDALAGALGVPRERIWYVGDNARGDVGGALAAGLRAVWFDWEGQQYPADLPPPTLTIASLRELEALIENGIDP